MVGRLTPFTSHRSQFTNCICHRDKTRFHMRDASAPCVPASAAPQPTGSTGLLPLALEFLMRRFFSLLFVLIAAFLACGALAAPAPGAEPTHADAEEHHIPLKPDVLFQ